MQVGTEKFKRRSAMQLLAGGMAALISSPAEPASPRVANNVKTARAILLRSVQQNSIPGAAVAVRLNGKLIWSEAFGFADLAFPVKATTTTRFRLASVSKPITAAIAVSLAKKGLLALDKPICTYAPDLPRQHCGTTLSELLSHRGGVRHYQDKDYDITASGGRPDTRVYPDEASKLAVFINDPLVAQPGTRTVYSTYGYVLAGYVMERATNLKFAALLDREIATPLGLRSLATDDIFAVRDGRASGYDPIADYLEIDPALTGKVVRTDAFNSMFRIPAGGLIATAEDVSAFGSTTIAETLPFAWESSRNAAGNPIRFVTGSQQGSRAILYLDQTKHLSIAVLTNLGDRPKDIRALAEKIAAQF